MKRFTLLTALILLVTLTMCLFFACNKNEPVTLDLVTVSADENGLSFTYSDVDSVYYVLDDGEEEEIVAGFYVGYSETVGEHTVKVFVRKEDGTVIASSEFTYTTVEVSLSDLSIAGKTVAWVAKAKTVSVKAEGDYTPVTEDSYTAPKDNITVRVKAEGGYDASTATYYVGNAVTKSARILPETATPLTSPTLTVVDNVVHWNASSKASGYVVSYDGASFVEATTATLSDSFGDHTISVKALGDGTLYADSLPTVLRYTTSRASLSLEKIASDRVKIASDFPVECSVNGDEYTPYTGSTYEAAETCSVTFRAKGSYDVRKSCLYLDGVPKTISFVSPAARPAVVEDASEGGIESRWVREKYESPSWERAASEVSVDRRYDDTLAMKMSAWNNSVAYRFTATYALTEGYDYLSFYYKGDGVSNVYFSLTDGETGYFIRRDLGVMPDYWLRVTLRLDDEEWMINGSFSLQTAWSLRKSEQAKSFDLPQEIIDAYELYEIIPFLDRASFTIVGNTPNGAPTAHYMDELFFGYDPEIADGIYQPLFAKGVSYVAYEELADETMNELLLFLDDENAFRLYSTALEENFILRGEYVLNEDFSTLRIEDPVAEVVVTMSFADNGASLSVVDATGDLASHFAARTFALAADMRLDFEDGEVGSPYRNDKWTAYTFTMTEGWKALTTPQMNCRARNGSSVVNFATGRYLTNKFIYNEGGRSLGLANYFAIELGNYFTNAEAIGVKLIAVDESGARYYLLGSENAFYSYPVTNDLYLLEATLPEAIRLATFEVATKNLGEQNAVYLYADNLVVKYKADPSVFSGYAAPIITPGDYALTFSHEDESAVLEYSVNNGEWQIGGAYSVPAVAGNYTLHVRGKIGDDAALTKVATYSFSVEEVYLSPISVEIDDAGHTAFWSTNGKASVKADLKKDDGQIEQGVFTPTNEGCYFTDKNIILSVLAEGYFDAEGRKYYVGTQELSKKILVDVHLAAPVIVPTQEGIAWGEVEDANAYSVSVNGGDYVTRADRVFPFATNEGVYTLRVMSVMIDEQGETSAYSNYTEYSYEVRNVALSALSLDKATVSWTAACYKIYLKINNGEYLEWSENRYVADDLGAHIVSVKAAPGFDLDNHIYYHTSKDVIKETTVSVSVLPAPTLLLNQAKDGLYWAFVNEENGNVTTVSDMQSAYPFLTYQISVNGGVWQNASSMEYPFPTTEGVYSVRVKAIGNGENYRDSESSEAYVFEVKTVSLSDIEITVQEESGSEAVYTYTAYKAYRKVGDGGSYTSTSDTTFTTKVTTTLYLRVEGGYDEENHVYYAGSAPDKEKKVIVPIVLGSPVISHSQAGITWSEVQTANAYSVSVNGGTPRIVTNRYLEYSAEYGTYTVEIKAIHTESPLQYPDGAPVSITYRVVKVALSPLSIDGAVVSWTYDGFISLKLGENGTYAPYDKDYYANESGDDETVYVKAEAGYDDENIVIYRGNTCEEYLDVVYSTLLTPMLELNATKDGLKWDAVSKARGYAYKVLPFGATESDIAAAAENADGWTDTTGTQYTFPETDGDYLLLLKAVGNGSTISDSIPAEWRYKVRTVALSDWSVTRGVATWTKTGLTTIQTVKGVQYSGFSPIKETTYAPTETLHVDLICSAGYDEEENVYYHGEQIKWQNLLLIVPIYLEAPTVTMTEDGIELGSVANADSYKVKINSGDYGVTTNTTLSFSNAVGTYVVKVRAYNGAEEEQYPESEDAEITYTVREVSLSDITDDTGVARYTAVGLLSVKEAGWGDYDSIETQFYAPAATTTVTVRAATGVDVSGQIVYIGETVWKSKKIVVPIKLSAPILTEGAERLSIGAVANANGYYISIDGGEWTSYGDMKVDYAAANGAHTISVKAYSTDSQQYPDSDPATVTYTTYPVTLSDLTLSGVTFTWTASGYTVRTQVNGGSFNATSSYSYTATATGKSTLYVRAYKGYLSSQHAYYYCDGDYIEKSKSVTITKLSTPSLSVSGNKVIWSAVSGSTGYAVKVNGGSYSNQSGTEKAFATQEGSYTVYVRAIGNGTTVRDSDEASYSYTVKTVTLSNLSVVGAKASWSAVAYRTYLSVNGGAYSATTATSYTAPSEGTYTLKVKAEGGWDSSNKIYYYASSAIEKTATVKVYSLAVPTLTANSKGISWNAVTNATGYSVKVDGGNYKTQTDRSVSFSTTDGTHTVYVKAVGAANSGYQDSAAVSYSYTTKKTSFSFLSSTNTMTTFLYEGVSAQYSTDNGSTYKDTSLTGYTATANGTVKFRAVGGWDAVTNTYYNGTTSAQSKSFTLPGFVINANFENGTGNWTKDYYNNSWVTASSVSVSSVVDGYGAGYAVKLHSYLNSMSYRFGYSFGDLPGNYKSLSFDIKLNAHTSKGTTFRFQDSASQTYVDYNLDHLNLTSGVWYHITVGFEDSHLNINSNNRDFTPAEAIRYLGESGYYGKIKALDKMYVMVKGNVSGGVDAYTYIDNFQFSTSVVSTATKTQITTKEVDFNNGSTASWKQYKYQANAYVESGNVSVATASDNDRVLNLYAGGTTYKFTYNEGGSTIGTVNHFSIDLGGDKNDTVRYRVELITESGGVIYVAGGENILATMSTNGISSLQTLCFNFSATKIKSVVIYASSSNGHLFVDNLILTKLS